MSNDEEARPPCGSGEFLALVYWMAVATCWMFVFLLFVVGVATLVLSRGEVLAEPIAMMAPMLIWAVVWCVRNVGRPQ